MNEICNSPSSNKKIETIVQRYSITIPIIITFICTLFDILSKACVKDIDICDAYLLFEIIISYFFPTIFSTASVIAIIHYFKLGYSGIRKGCGKRFGISTVMLFVLHIAYLFLIKTIFIFFFFAFLCIYITLFIVFFMDRPLISGIGLDDILYDRSVASGRED